MGRHRPAAGGDLHAARRRARPGRGAALKARLEEAARRVRLPRHPAIRIALVVAVLAGLGALFYWRGPNWSDVGKSFAQVQWALVAAAVGWNLVSVVVRALAWRTVINQSMPKPHPRFLLIFSAFSVGLFANAVLPGRVGELARVGVVQRKLASRRGAWATLVGTVFAHRVFDIVPVVGLLFYTLSTAKIPKWATTSLVIVVAAGIVLLLLSFVGARRHSGGEETELRRVRTLVRMGREGLGVMHDPLAAALAIFFQCLGWLTQLLAVYTTMRAFNIHAPMPAAALVLLLINVATIVPLWPGNFGATQALIAVPLSTQYGVEYGHAFAFGVGLQAIEASVGVGVGSIFLLREGLSYASLKAMPSGESAFEQADEAAEELEHAEGGDDDGPAQLVLEEEPSAPRRGG